jgi:hypothetical protein
VQVLEIPPNPLLRGVIVYTSNGDAISVKPVTKGCSSCTDSSLTLVFSPDSLSMLSKTPKNKPEGAGTTNADNVLKFHT